MAERENNVHREEKYTETKVREKDKQDVGGKGVRVREECTCQSHVAHPQAICSTTSRALH